MIFFNLLIALLKLQVRVVFFTYEHNDHLMIVLSKLMIT